MEAAARLRAATGRWRGEPCRRAASRALRRVALCRGARLARGPPRGVAALCARRVIAARGSGDPHLRCGGARARARAPARGVARTRACSRARTRAR